MSDPERSGGPGSAARGSESSTTTGVNGRRWLPAQRTDEMITAPPVAETGAVQPAVVLDLDLSDPLPSVPAVAPDGRRVAQAWVLVRLFTEPIGTVLVEVPHRGLRPAELATAIDRDLGATLRPRLAELTPGTAEPAVPVDGITPAAEPPFLARRREVLATAPHITVVVCTRERPGALARCLDSLLAQE